MTFRKEVLAEGVEVYCGDCLEVLPTLGRFDAVVTDPPYGISDSALKLGNRTGKRRGGDNVWHAESYWDHALNENWCMAVCKASDVVAWFGQWRKREWAEEHMDFPIRAEIVWAKDCHAGPPSPVAPRDERIWVFSKAGFKGATFETSVWDEPIIPTWEHKHHKNEKPVALMARLLQWIGGKSVVDPFMGSGSTGVAAVKVGRQFTGIEKDAAHFDIACRRIEAALKQPDMFIDSPKPIKQEAFL